MQIDTIGKSKLGCPWEAPFHCSFLSCKHNLWVLTQLASSRVLWSWSICLSHQATSSNYTCINSKILLFFFFSTCSEPRQEKRIFRKAASSEMPTMVLFSKLLDQSETLKIKCYLWLKHVPEWFPQWSGKLKWLYYSIKRFWYWTSILKVSTHLIDNAWDSTKIY